MGAVATAIQTPAAAAAQGDETVRIVRLTLKGPVMQVLRKLVPELSEIPEAEGYDHTLRHLPLLDKCFKAFRENRHLFNHILTDKTGRVVSNDSGLLSCGHNIDIVVAMVVRTAAKRYFRHHVGLPQRAGKTASLLGKVKSAIASGKPPSLAEDLYDRIKAFLLYEWQVPLVPTYAKLSPDQVSTLGAKLLKLSDEAALAEAAGLPTPKKSATAPVLAAAMPRPSSPPPAKRPAPPAMKYEPVKPAPVVMTPVAPPIAASQPVASRAAPAQPSQPAQPAGNGKKLSGSNFTSALALPQVKTAIDPILHGDYSVRIIDLVGSHAWADLILILGIRRKDQLAVLILNAFATLGPQEFNRIFGNKANPAHLDQLLADFDHTEINPDSSIPQIVAFVIKTFTPQRTTALQ